jgi:PPOX class probable F420-dependent enzyme
VPTLPFPPDVDELLRRLNPAVVATVRPDGSPHSVATWYLWDGSRALLNMDESRARLAFLRHEPRLSLTVLDADSWYRQVNLDGFVARLVDDTEFEDIDRLARHSAAISRPRASPRQRLGRDRALATGRDLGRARPDPPRESTSPRTRSRGRLARLEPQGAAAGARPSRIAWYQAGRGNRVGCERQLERPRGGSGRSRRSIVGSTSLRRSNASRRHSASSRAGRSSCRRRAFRVVEPDCVQEALHGDVQPPVAVEEQQQPERHQGQAAREPDPVVVVPHPAEGGHRVPERDPDRDEGDRDPQRVRGEQDAAADDRPRVGGQRQDCAEHDAHARRGAHRERRPE